MQTIDQTMCRITTDRTEQSLGLSNLVNLATCELISSVAVVHMQM